MVGHHPAIKTGIKRLCVYILFVLYPHESSEGDITSSYFIQLKLSNIIGLLDALQPIYVGLGLPRRETKVEHLIQIRGWIRFTYLSIVLPSGGKIHDSNSTAFSLMSLADNLSLLL